MDNQELVNALVEYNLYGTMDNIAPQMDTKSGVNNIELDDNYIESCETYDESSNGKKYYSCTFCTYRCPKKSNFILHMRTHTGEKPYACTLCDYRCLSKSRLVRHTHSHTGDKPFLCLHCDFKCTLKNNLIVHMRAHTGEKPFSCTQCDYKCGQSSTLVTHMRSHTGERPYVCTVCDYKSSYKSHLISHMRKHTGEKPFKCEMCEYSCAQRSALTMHMIGHNDEKKFTCTHCGYKCKRKSEINAHVRSHTGEKPFTCKICNISCTRSNTLANHMKTHTSEKPFNCEHCDYKCIQRGSLVNHMRTHTGEKPYQCKECTFKCARAFNLVTHMRTHTGEKPYKCDVCDYRTAAKARLNRHVKIHNKSDAETVCGGSDNKKQKCLVKKYFKCYICKYKTAYKKCFSNHLKKHDNKLKTISVKSSATKNPKEIRFITNKSKKIKGKTKNAMPVNNVKLDPHLHGDAHMKTCVCNTVLDQQVNSCKNHTCNVCIQYPDASLNSHTLTHSNKDESEPEPHFVAIKQEFDISEKGQAINERDTLNDLQVSVKEELYDSSDIDLNVNIVTMNNTPAVRHGSYTCDICYDQFEHNNWSRQMYFRCDHCTFMTRHKSSLVRHIQSHKANEKIFNCHICNYKT